MDIVQSMMNAQAATFLMSWASWILFGVFVWIAGIFAYVLVSIVEKEGPIKGAPPKSKDCRHEDKG